ncbi:MAG: SDR family NAD(P)-dependent oxidoreductase, partial [Woeseiaceae bacterium]|nr:SDR family NAD(P)-dependent oxidoreductase [Woeseiaceae bacterium]
MGDPLRLYGLKALVLNAADGVGEAVARTLVKHGADVIALGSRNSGIERHFDGVKGITGQAALLTDPGQLPTVIEGALAELGGIDILVNDFPVYPSKPFDEHDDGLDNLLQLRS